MQVSERLAKQWEVTERLLREAVSEIGEVRNQDFEEFLAHNELGLALDTLVDVGTRNDPEPGPTFWRLLKQAADVIGANRHRNNLRNRYRNALARESGRRL